MEPEVDSSTNSPGSPSNFDPGLNGKAGSRQDFETETFIVRTDNTGANALNVRKNIAGALDSGSPQAVCVTGPRSHALTGEGHDASEDGTGRGTPIVAFSCKDHGQDAGEVSPTLRAMGHSESHANGDGQVAIAFQERGRKGGRSLESQENVAYALTAPNGGGRGQERNIVHGLSVRRLTPRECERLQGWPDDHTRYRADGREIKDGPRYRMIGNGVAEPCARWIARRLAAAIGVRTLNLQRSA